MDHFKCFQVSYLYLQTLVFFFVFLVFSSCVSVAKHFLLSERNIWKISLSIYHLLSEMTWKTSYRKTQKSFSFSLSFSLIQNLSNFTLPRGKIERKLRRYFTFCCQARFPSEDYSGEHLMSFLFLLNWARIYDFV